MLSACTISILSVFTWVILIDGGKKASPQRIGVAAVRCESRVQESEEKHHSRHSLRSRPVTECLRILSLPLYRHHRTRCNTRTPTYTIIYLTSDIDQSPHRRRGCADNFYGIRHCVPSHECLSLKINACEKKRIIIAVNLMTRIVPRFVEFNIAQILVTLPRALPQMLIGNQGKRALATILVLVTSIGSCLVSFSLCKRVTRLLRLFRTTRMWLCCQSSWFFVILNVISVNLFLLHVAFFIHRHFLPW